MGDDEFMVFLGPETGLDSSGRPLLLLEPDKADVLPEDEGTLNQISVGGEQVDRLLRGKRGELIFEVQYLVIAS